MGGGTTVVEALRLGCKVIGIDLNPVAWFIVKCETTPVDIKELEAAFQRLANRIVPWSGKPLRQTLLELYKTTCPCCGNPDADIIYVFWVKSAICTDPTCRKQVPLFSDYIVAAKSHSIRYYQDVSCPNCHKTFDWELEPASLIAEQSLTVVNSADGAGVGRGNKRWAFARQEPVGCPWCGQSVKPTLAPGKTKPVRKKVPLTVLLCPHCQAVWQYRGTVPDRVTCPACQHQYDPAKGNVPQSGKFVCPHCGKKGAIINSIRSLPEDQLLPMSMYAIQGWCRGCGKGGGNDEAESEDFFQSNRGPSAKRGRTVAQQAVADDHRCLLAKSAGKFFKRIQPADLELYARAARLWEQHKSRLPYPKSEIPEGFNTNQMIKHNYRYWWQMFTFRELLGLGSLIEAIQTYTEDMRDFVLAGFSSALEGNNVFCRYTIPGGNKSQGIFSRHDYQPKLTFTENNLWGTAFGHGTFVSKYACLIDGARFAHRPTDRKVVQKPNGATKLKDHHSGESVYHHARVDLRCGDSRYDTCSIDAEVHHVITDPPMRRT